jgi:hypothetical protein
MLGRIYLFLDELGEGGVLTGDFFRYLVRRPFDHADTFGYGGEDSPDQRAAGPRAKG